MDELDLRILGMLAWKPGDPVHMARGILRPWDIARKLGVHGNTVKTRIAEMREQGVLMNVFLTPGGMFPDLKMAVYWFEFDSATKKRDGIAKLAGSLDVGDIHDFVGRLVRARVVAKRGEPVETVAQRVRIAAGAQSARFFYANPSPPPATKFGVLDYRIARALMPDALRPFPSVADELGVTAKTVRQRFAGLAAARAFGLIPGMVLGKMRGLVAFELDVEFERMGDPAVHEALWKTFPNAFGRAGQTAENAYLYLAAAETSQIEDAVLRAQRIPGVRTASAQLVREVTANQESFLRLVDERIEAMRTQPPAA